MPKFFALETPADLFGKLERDLARMEADPHSSDAAYCFFVTAYHMAEWVCPDPPGDKGGSFAERKRRFYGDPDVSIARDVANGAKHFESERTVVASTSAGAFSAAFQPNFQGGLWIKLHDGQRLSALAVARRLVEFWRRHTK